MKKILCLTLALTAAACAETPDDTTTELPIASFSTHAAPEAVLAEVTGDAEVSKVADGGGGGCRVVLEWCRHPSTGQPVCWASSGCSLSQAIDWCTSLINRTCGFSTAY